MILYLLWKNVNIQKVIHVHKDYQVRVSSYAFYEAEGLTVPQGKIHYKLDTRSVIVSLNHNTIMSKFPIVPYWSNNFNPKRLKVTRKNMHFLMIHLRVLLTFELLSLGQWILIFGK